MKEYQKEHPVEWPFQEGDLVEFRSPLEPGWAHYVMTDWGELKPGDVFRVVRVISQIGGFYISLEGFEHRVPEFVHSQFFRKAP